MTLEEYPDGVPFEESERYKEDPEGAIRYWREFKGYVLPVCAFCVHKYHREWRCAAFPDGIPPEMNGGKNPHTEPFPGDNGIRFEVEPGREEQAKEWTAWDG